MDVSNVSPKRIEYPKDTEQAPKDVGETYDYVVRKGPISYDGIMDSRPPYTPDEVYRHLEWLVKNDYLVKESGSLEEHGTTSDVYSVHEKRVED